MKRRLPILLLFRSSAENSFAKYLLEILAIEGYFFVETWNLSEEDDLNDLLAGRPLVILAHISLTSRQIDALKSYVKNGGNLIASRPPKEMVDIFGVKPIRGHYNLARDCFVVINHNEPLMAGFPASSLQFFGDADVYEPKNSRVLAWLSAIPHRRTPYATITLAKYGRGQTALFAYNLEETIVTLHQGRPENASTGINRDADRSGMFKTTSLHVKVLDERLKMLPQADLHQDILVRLIRAMTESALPIIRVWHFPYEQPAVALIDGDSDMMEQRDLLRLLDIAEHYKARYTIYLMKEHFKHITPDLMRRLQKMGHDIGVHPWPGTYRPSLEEMKKALNDICREFEERFGFKARSSRMHGVIWAGWVESAKYMADNGLRMDTSFTPGRYYQEGFICGSGLPFKFIDENGEIIDLYEQATIEGDDILFTLKSLLPPLMEEEAIEHAIDMIDRCISAYHCVYHPYYHPIRTRREFQGTRRLKEVLSWLKRRGVLTVNSAEWIDFNDARRALRFFLEDIDENEGLVSYQIIAQNAILGVTMMMPSTWRGSRLKEVLIEDSPVDLKFVRWEGGLEWGVFTLNLHSNQQLRITCKYDIKNVENG